MLTYPIDLTNGPGPRLAWVARPDPDLLAEHAVALANTDGGALVIGLDGSGRYVGAPDGGAVARALRAAGEQCNPSITLDHFELIPTPGGPAVAVHVPRADRVHALRDGRVIARSAFGNRALNGDEIRALLAARATGDFEAEVVPGARPAHLDPALLAEFLVRRAARLSHSRHPDQDDLLLAMGAITPEYDVTVAGMLLFGADPQRWLPDSGARFVRVIGTRADSQARIALDQTITGPVTHVIDGLLGLIQQQAQGYSAATVRETLINAVCHRDYRLRGDPVTVRLFSDRLEIASPGGLPGFLTLAHLTGGRFSRNPRLTWGLYHWGYGDAAGAGILTMLASADSRRPPEIEAGPYTVNVRLYATPHSDAEHAPGESHLSAWQQQALAYVRDTGSITLRELRTLCAGCSPDQLHRELTALVAEERLRKVGPPTAPFYILP
jgi:ATP-dependent DNA helicase RecG